MVVAGESRGALTLGPGAVVTKGRRPEGVRAPEADGRHFAADCALGANRARRVWTAVIDASNLDGETLYDRIYFEPGAGLAGNAGEAIAASTWRYQVQSTPLVFDINKTSFVWLLATGKAGGHVVLAVALRCGAR